MQLFESVLSRLFGPNQCCPIVVWKSETGFLVMLFCGPHLFFHGPYYDPLAWFMKISHKLPWLYHLGFQNAVTEMHAISTDPCKQKEPSNRHVV